MKIALVAVLAAAALTLRAETGSDGQVLSAAHQARIAHFDKGPSSIDVSTYPRAVQADYRIFRERCSACHTLSRPINSDYALPNEWSLYILRMMSKPGANISANDSRRIYDFLVYDSSARKSNLLQTKLASLAPNLRSAMLARIASVRHSYGAR